MKPVQFAITKMSTKGQIVIPKHLRDSFDAGEEFLVIVSDGKLVLKSLRDVASSVTDDIKVALRVEEAYKRYSSGKFKKVSAQKFLADMKKW